MFATNDVGEINVPSGLAEEGERLWQYVIQRIPMPWFHIEYKVAGPEDLNFARIMFTPYLPHIEQLNKMSDTSVVRVSLMSPPSMNGTDDWKLESLAEVWETKDDTQSKIYVLKNGVRYSENSRDSKKEVLSEADLLLRID